MLMHGLLADGAQRHPDRLCFHWVDRDRGLSYGEAAAATDDMAAVLHEVGVRPGDRVTILAHNGLDYLTAMFGCFRLGAIAALVNVRFADELNYYLADHDPAAIVYTHDLGEAVRAAASSRATLRALLCMDGPQPGALSLPEMLAAGLPPPPVASDETAVAHLSYTSGTTGKPKGAALRHEPTVRASRGIAERLRITGTDVSFGPTALSSSYQLVGNLLPQLSKGASINVMGKWTAEAGFDALGRRHATMLVGNPIVLGDYLDEFRRRGHAVPTLRMALSGGGPVPPQLKQAWTEEIGVPLVESYGQSELGGFVALGYPVADIAEARSRRVGPPLPDKEVRIFSPAGVHLPPGKIGEIGITGGHMAFYWGKPEKTAEVLKDGWLMTGDLGFMDADGCVTMLGRRSELLQVAGAAWYPRDIEEILAQIEPVHMAALVGVPEAGGHRPVAVVTLAGTAALDFERARAAIAANTPYDVSRLEIRVIEAMPMTPTGKIAKAELAQRLSRDS